jgi:four helix bundle protein
MNSRKGPIQKQSFKFAVNIIQLYESLKNRNEYTISRQLLRSGTAIGALVSEAQNAESKADFIHKLGIAQKECAESLYWLELLEYTSYIDSAKCKNLSKAAIELLKMIRSAILTTKQKVKSTTHNS